MARVNKLVSLVALLILIIPLISLSLPETASAAEQIINGGFETGDFSGWDVTIPPGGAAQVVTRYDSPNPPPATYLAQEGNYFAWLKTDGPASYTVVSQPFRAAGGIEISGWAFFKAEDYLPWNDESKVEITVNNDGGPVLATVFEASVSTVGDFGGTPWTYWSYVFISSGSYTIQARITNAYDTSVDSCMGIDGVSMNVPGFVAQKQPPRSSPAMPATTPAVIIVRNMKITPEQTYAGQTIAISANMANDGDQAGGYTAPLKINGKVEQTKIGAVDGHSAIPVNFIVSKYQPGTYTVDIGGQKGTFTILAANTASGQSASSAAVVILIMGVLVLSTIVVLILTFRRPA